MSQNYEITEEDSIHNRSHTSIIEINLTHQNDANDKEVNEDYKYKLKDVFSANFDEFDMTNRLYIVKRNALIDAKIELQFEFSKTKNDTEEVNTEIKRLQDKYQRLELKDEETNKIIYQQNVFQKFVEKQLDTKSLIFEKIIPSQIEKHSLAVKTLLSDHEVINNSWLQNSKILQNLLEAKENLMEINRKCFADLQGFANNDESADCEKLHQQKMVELQAQKINLKSANDAKVDHIRKLIDENIIMNELMSAEMNSHAEILNMNITQQEKVDLLYKTLEEKKTNYLNSQHNLWPSIQSKKLEYDAIQRRNLAEKEDVTNKANALKQDLMTHSKEILQVEVDTIRLDFFSNRDKEALTEKITNLGKSILGRIHKSGDLQKSKDEADLTLQHSIEETKIYINTANNKKAEIDEANKQLDQLSAENDSIDELIEKLQNSLNDLSGSEVTDIDLIEKEIGILCNIINKIKEEKSEKQKVYSDELNKAEAIDLVTLDTKLIRLRREKQSVLDKIEDKNEKHDSLTTRVTSVELAIRELIRTIKKNPRNLLAFEPVNARNPKTDMGILKRLGEKSPAKRVHFESSLPGTSSQTTAEDVSQNMNYELINPELIIPIGVSSSPPTRLQTKKKKNFK